MAKLVVGVMTPVAVAAFGYWLSQRLRSFEQAQWSQQKVIERRIKAYDELAVPLNKLFCFFCYVGSWKETDPPSVVKMKRDLDQTAHVSAPLFDAEFLERYNQLMDMCFATFGGWGDDAKLRTLTDRREEIAEPPWNEAWGSCFSARSEASEPHEVKTAYVAVMGYLAKAIGATEVDAHLLGSTRLPGNFDRQEAGVVSRIRGKSAVDDV